MDISAGLIAKGTAGALAASATVGGGVWAGTNGWFDGLFRSNAVENEEVAQPVLDVQGGADSHLESQVSETTPGGETEQEGTPATGGLEGGHPLDSTTGRDNPSGVGKPANDLVGTDQDHTHDSTTGGGKKGQKSKLTKWDNALINYLKESGKDDRDIIFDVKTGKSPSDIALSTTFPTLEGDTQKKLIITATVTTSNTNLTGTDHSEKITELQKMNGGETNPQNWSWECKIILSKANKAGDSINLENKEKLIGENGYLNKLTIAGEKDLKAKFIENCANFRNSAKTKEYGEKNTLEDGKICVEKTFKFKNDNTGLEDKDKKDFDDWFLTTPAQPQ